jgi:hypothetical protein
MGKDGIIHMHRRFTRSGSEFWCGGAKVYVLPSDFIAEPRQHQTQCLRCQDAAAAAKRAK